MYSALWRIGNMLNVTNSQFPIFQFVCINKFLRARRCKILKRNENFVPLHRQMRDTEEKPIKSKNCED